MILLQQVSLPFPCFPANSVYISCSVCLCHGKTNYRTHWVCLFCENIFISSKNVRNYESHGNLSLKTYQLPQHLYCKSANFDWSIFIVCAYTIFECNFGLLPISCSNKSKLNRQHCFFTHFYKFHFVIACIFQIASTVCLFFCRGTQFLGYCDALTLFQFSFCLCIARCVFLLFPKDISKQGYNFDHAILWINTDYCCNWEAAIHHKIEKQQQQQ